MALINGLKAIGDAIREQNGTTELIPFVDMPQAILDIVSGGGIEYTDITYNEDNTITLTDTDGVEHTMECEYTDGKLTSVKYDGKAVELIYDGDVLVKVGKTEIDMSNAPITPSGASLNISYGETPPEDTSKLWVKAKEPDSLVFKRDIDGVESIGLSNTHLPTACSGVGCVKVGTKIYMFGGGSLNTIQVFDIETETLTTLSTTLPTSLHSMGCAAVGTNIYLIGGHTTGNISTKIYKFDTETETITTLSPTMPGRVFDLGCVSVNDKIYLFGGYDAYRSWYKNIYVFDPQSETLTTLGITLPTYLHAMGCASVGDKIYLFGGYNDTNGVLENIIRMFDTKTETLTTLDATLHTAADHMGCVSVGTKVYLFGGNSSGSLSTIQVFDAETETISTLNTALPIGLNNMGCVAAGMKVYLFGGYATANLNTIYTFAITHELAQGDIELQTSFLNNVFKLINTDNAQVEIGVESVFIGNENNEAEPVDAYLHNGIEWSVIV